jgi:hypothetical protein
MEATEKMDGPLPKGNGVRLRIEVYDALAGEKGLTSVAGQARRHGIGRTHMSLIRAGRKGVGLSLAMRMASDLETTVEALFGRVPRR